MAWKMKENKIFALEFELLYVEFELKEAWKLKENSHRLEGSNS